MRRIILRIILLSLFLFCLLPHLVAAEGSKELVGSGGDRAFLDFTNVLQAGLKRRTIINVYVKDGELIHLGSSANGLGNGKIIVTAPDGTIYTSNGLAGEGVINNNIEEQAGPLPAVGGYKPFTIKAQSSGIYLVEFRAPDLSNSAGGANYKSTAPWNRAIDQPTNQAQVLAWDATVLRNDKPVLGRAYTNSFAGTMRSNGRSFSAMFYVLTDNGWLYSIDGNGMDPYGFIFLANNRGNQAKGRNESAFKSTTQADAMIADPELPDSSTITHKIFFNLPAKDMPEFALRNNENVWLKPSPPPSPSIENFAFIGLEGTPGVAGFGLGGNFHFDTNLTGRYKINIDINDNGLTTDPVDIALIADMHSGENSLPWDGRNGLGEYVSPGMIKSKAVTLSGVYGEVHFPLYDAENNPNGLILTRLNGPNAPDSTIYYDDRAFADSKNFPGGVDGRAGKSSSGGAHTWTGNGGDMRVIDTWGLINHPPVAIDSPIIIRAASLLVMNQEVKPAKIYVGSTVYFLADIVNNGPSDIEGVEIFDYLPAEFDLKSETTIACDSDTPFNQCVSGKIDGRIVSVTASLKAYSTTTVKIMGSLNKVSKNGALTNTIGVLRPADTFDEQATVGIADGFEMSFETLKDQCILSGFVSPSCDNLSTLSLSNIENATTTSVTDILISKPIIVNPWPTLPKVVVLPKATTTKLDPETFTTTVTTNPYTNDSFENAATDFATSTLNCEPYLTTPLGPSSALSDIARLRFLLNTVSSTTLPLAGGYDEDIIEAVKAYQEKNLHKITILKASGKVLPTGIVDEFTMGQLNVDYCYLKVEKRCPYFFDYLTLGDQNDTHNKLQESTTTQVNVWKEFLWLLFPSQPQIYNGLYDSQMRNIVGDYQTQYRRTILSPWQYANPQASVTYYLREASRNWANYMVNCPEGPIELYDGSGNVDYH